MALELGWSTVVRMWGRSSAAQVEDPSTTEGVREWWREQGLGMDTLHPWGTP